MLKHLKEFFKIRMETKTFYKYGFTLTLVNGEVIEAEAPFYSIFDWINFSELYIFDKSMIVVRELSINTKNILTAVLTSTETTTREYREDSMRIESKVYEK